jgi:hypothetical protein
MRKVILSGLFLSLIQLACGQMILDVSVTTQYIPYENDYYEVHSVERFTLTATTPVDEFMIGITAPLPYIPPQEVYLWEDVHSYPVNPHIMWSELDVHIPNQMPIVNVLNPDTIAMYVGTDDNNMNIWWVLTDSPTGVTGPIIEFVYTPEPACAIFMLLGTAWMAARRKL